MTNSAGMKAVVSVGAALLALALSGAYLTASAQPATCKRYQEFEGLWDGTIRDEKIERRYPQPHLSVPSYFDPDHRRLNIVYRGSDYQVIWNSVEGENVPSLRETARIAEDSEGYCQQVRRQSQNLDPSTPGIRINISGSYTNGRVPVRFSTKMCCFAYQMQAITCAAATHYETYGQDAYGREGFKPWYDGLWYVTMLRPPRPNDCESRDYDQYPPQQPSPQQPGDDRGESGF